MGWFSKRYTLTVSKAGTGDGTIAGASVGTQTIRKNRRMSLSATASGSSTFAGLSGGTCSGTGNCLFTMDQNRSVTATFNSGGDGSAFSPGAGDTILFDTRTLLQQATTLAEANALFDFNSGAGQDFANASVGFNGSNGKKALVANWFAQVGQNCLETNNHWDKAVTQPNQSDMWFQWKAWSGRTQYDLDTGGWGTGNVGAFKTTNPNCCGLTW